MRYRLAVLMLLMLLVVLPMMNVLAAPAPDPSAILDIGPPSKEWGLEKHCQNEIDNMSSPDGMLMNVWCNPKVRKLPSVSRFKDACPWLAQNIRIRKEDGGRRLRLTFRAGTRAEQVAILNELLRVNLRAQERGIKFQEECLRSHEECIVGLERRIASGQEPESVDSFREGIKELRSIRIPAVRAEIARMKQFGVVKWAK